MMNEGYLSLEEIQQESLRILEAFDAFCAAHGLCYSLAGGTLLGAVRHGGFIPWDDDIDVTMPRPDHTRLCEMGAELERETGLHLQGYPDGNSQNPPFVMLANRLIKKKSRFWKDPIDLGIDIFPVDGLPADEKEVGAIYRKAALLRKPLIVAQADPAEGKTAPRRILKSLFAKVNRVLSVSSNCEQRLNELARRYPYGKTDYVGAITWGIYGPGERMDKASFEMHERLDFEGKQFPVVSCWDAYLSGIYGDYMELPPEAERKAREVKAWRVGRLSCKERE